MPTAPVTTSSTVSTVASLPRTSPTSSTADSGNDWDCEDEKEDNESIDNASNGTALGDSKKGFAIFGVQLTSANVLFQLEEIDDVEVREWIAQFARQSEPSLLGG